MKKRIVSILLCMVMTIGLVVPTMADEIEEEIITVQTTEDIESDNYIETEIIEEEIVDDVADAEDELAESEIVEDVEIVDEAIDTIDTDIDSVDADDDSTVMIDELGEGALFEDEIVEDGIEEITNEEGAEDEILAEDGLIKTAKKIDGLMPLEFVEDPEAMSKPVAIDCDAIMEDIDELASCDGGAFDFETAINMATYGSAVYNNEWDRYANNYVYNMLPEAKKIVWKALDKVSLDVLNDSSRYIQYTDMVSSSAFSSITDLQHFLAVYRYSNPQYFFYSNRIVYGNDSRPPYRIAFGLYNNMQSGSNRAAAVSKFKNGIAGFKKQISGSTDYQKIKSLADVMERNVTYNHDSVSTQHRYEEYEYTQSAYSTFVLHTTVCAGYALATELLLNDMGIDGIAVTSSGHAWDYVRLNGTWYNLDNTWIDDDDYDGPDYSYFLKSDSYLASDGAHVIENHWKGLVPSATHDSGSYGHYAYEPSAPTKTVGKPVIKFSGNTVTITSSTSGAKIYYTLDGINPSCSSTRSHLYNGSFTYPGTGVVKAIAIRDGYKDSAVATGSKIVAGWCSISDSYTNGYTFVKTDGSLVKNTWFKVGAKWYHFNKYGIMETGWIKVGDKWYFLNVNGVMQTGWLNEGKNWYFLNANGVMQKGWTKVGTKWYYLDPSNGIMHTGWTKVGNQWFYLNVNGVMQLGWVRIDGKDYYFHSDGHMAANEWIGKYHVNANGVWDKTR